MLMNLLLDPYAHYNASSLVLVVANLVCVFVIVFWIMEVTKYNRVGFLQLFHVRPMRMLIGAAVGFFGVAVGSIMWLPAFPILISENQELSTWYVGIATWPANVANLVSVVGMSIILWPWLKKRFGKSTPTIIGLLTLVVYLFGIVSSLVAGVLIKSWS